MKDLFRISYKEARRLDAEMKRSDDPKTRVYRILVKGEYVKGRYNKEYVYASEDLW